MLACPWWVRSVAPVFATLGVAGCTEQPAPLRKAPEFAYTLLDGTAAHSQALRGRVVLVNFWATTCGVCVKEMPQLVSTHAKFQAQGLHTLAVAMQYDPPALVADFAQSRQLPFGVVIDNTGAIAKSFGDVRGTPTSYLINRQGQIALRVEGEPDFARLHQHINQLLTQA